MKPWKGYDKYEKVSKLINAICDKGLPPYDLSTEPGSGGLMIYHPSKSHPLVAYATPFWEGNCDLPFQTCSDEGKIGVTLTMHDVKWTGEIEKDVEVWGAAVAPLLKTYLPVT